jgi:hypothetical protein
MKHKLTIASDGDENVKILLDGEQVGAFNHDEHGWDGMESAIAVAIAEKLGMAIEHTNLEQEQP